ncbi:hypothetical protein EJ06DRAFT_490556 [Trichodelitschia bisporula]|uniref:Amino acid permease/ SLC12A domain-containing protein n=1 Tax=Trichodelitschia bisporula TaxID=703511 RepID=A0A6G1I1V6_9PEZI|nr:hypothetical protein EJ06DRAFT_490556 [Trichodelitschia bisporula]
MSKVPTVRRNSGSSDRPESLRPESIMTTGSDDATHETNLREELKERHVNMLAFSTVLGLGLFFGGGKIIVLAGPGLAVIAYILIGTVLWTTMATVGEMTALFPVRGPLFEFPRRFLDESIGFACAWLMWFSYVIALASQLQAIASVFQFQVAKEYLDEVGWPHGPVGWSTHATSSAVWVGIFLIIMGAVNLLPVRWYGRFEYVCGCLKIMFLVGLIMFNTILNAQKRFHTSRFWTYDSPYSFASKNYTVRDGVNKSSDPLVYEGSLGTFAGTWSGMTLIFFSMMGFEVIAISAAENKDLKNSETIKVASRKISLRVMLLYTLAIFTVGLNVPADDPNLLRAARSGLSGGQGSVFILSAIRNHLRFWPGFFNGFFAFSSTSTGINNIYCASRSLHALASTHDAWPRWTPVQAVRARLERTYHGVPYGAVFVSWVFGFLAFTAVSSKAADNLDKMATNSTISMLIVYAVNNASYLVFYRAINAAAGRSDDPEARKGGFKRGAPEYPYKSSGQWMRATYGLVATSILALFNGWKTFVPPFDTKTFVADYISLVLFFALSTMYFLGRNGLNPANWQRNATKLHGLAPTMVISGANRPLCGFCDTKHRRGQLRLPDRGLTVRNSKAVVEWLGVWIK